MHLSRRVEVFLCGLLLMTASGVAAAAEPVSASVLGRVAIGGHDTVAYHQIPTADAQQGAVPGVKTYTVKYKGANWRFASKHSSELFTANPERYAPGYNGHCANALSLGEGLIRTDGTHWEIFGDTLYLFYASRGRERWLSGDWQAYKAQADAAWQKLTQ